MCAGLPGILTLFDLDFWAEGLIKTHISALMIVVAFFTGSLL